MRDLTKKKLGQLSEALDAAQAAFRAEVDKIAEQARAEILPYFKKHGFDFRAGNGSWFITRPNGEHAERWVDDDELQRTSATCSCLKSLMPIILVSTSATSIEESGSHGDGHGT